MGEKIFGEIQTTEDLNELAKNLRKTKEFDEIRLLCSENDISEKNAEEFIKGDRLLLVENGNRKSNMGDDQGEELTEPRSDIGRAIESIERSAFDRVTKDKQALQSPTWKAVREIMKENMKGDEAAQRISDGRLLQGPVDEDYVQMGTASLKDILSGIPKPTEDEIKAAEKEQKTPVVYTVEDVKKKLGEELKIYKDGDSKYVVDKLIDLCATDETLLSAIMLPHKSYDKAFQYFYQQSRNVGYKMPHGNMVYLDNDKAVKLSVEYFKRDDAEGEDKKKQQKKTTTKPQISKKKQEDSKPQVPKKEVSKEADKAKKNPIEPTLKGIKPQKKEMDGQMSLFDF